MSLKDPYLQMLCEANSVKLGKQQQVVVESSGQQVVMEDNVITWFKSRGLNIQDLGGTVNPVTIFLFLAVYIVGEFAAWAGVDEAMSGNQDGNVKIVVARIAQLIAAVLANSKIKKEAREVLKTQPKERVVEYSASRVMGAHAIMALPEMNKTIQVGQGIDYLKRTEIIFKQLSKMKKLAQGYKKIAPDHRKDAYDAVIDRIEAKEEKMRKRIKVEKAKRGR